MYVVALDNISNKLAFILKKEYILQKRFTRWIMNNVQNNVYVCTQMSSGD